MNSFKATTYNQGNLHKIDVGYFFNIFYIAVHLKIISIVWRKASAGLVMPFDQVMPPSCL